MLTTATTEYHLRALLEATGIPLARMTAPQAWAVFKEFAVLPVEDAPDLALFFEWGCYLSWPFTPSAATTWHSCGETARKSGWTE